MKKLIRRLPALRAESGELLHLDALRFLAALGVVVLHFRASLALPAGWEHYRERVAPFSLMVDLFFILSGIVIAHVYSGRLGSLRQFGSFLQKRVARLVPLHWLTLAFYVVVAIAASQGMPVANPDRYAPDCLAANALLVHAVGGCSRPSFNFVSWSISAEMVCYLLAPLFLLLARWRRLAPFVIALGLMVLLSVAFPGSPGHRAWYNWSYSGGALRALPAFLFGVGLHANRELLKRLPLAGAGLAGSLAAFLLGCALGAEKAPLLPIVYAIAVWGFACDIQDRKSAVARTLAPLGQLTYSSYMLHPIVHTVLVTAIIDRVLSLDGAAKNFGIVIAFSATFVASYISFFAVETPLRRVISSWGRSNSRQLATPSKTSNRPSRSSKVSREVS